MLMFLSLPSIGALYHFPTQQAYAVDKADIILSSGFLAFARHGGFVKALEDFEVPYHRVVGTSSGIPTIATTPLGHE
jgi:predicted acylesterase/phospholipase RssA